MSIEEKFDKYLNEIKAGENIDEKTRLRKKVELVSAGVTKEISQLAAGVLEKLNDIKITFGDNMTKKEKDVLEKAKQDAYQAFSTVTGEFKARFDNDRIKELKKKSK